MCHTLISNGQQSPQDKRKPKPAQDGVYGQGVGHNELRVDSKDATAQRFEPVTPQRSMAYSPDVVGNVWRGGIVRHKSAPLRIHGQALAKQLLCLFNVHQHPFVSSALVNGHKPIVQQSLKRGRAVYGWAGLAIQRTKPPVSSPTVIRQACVIWPTWPFREVAIPRQAFRQSPRKL